MDQHPLSKGYEVVCCSRCGVGFADTSATQAEYDHFYAEESKYADPKTSTGSGCSKSDLARLRETAKCIEKFTSGHDGMIVDIGCAGGGLLKELKKLGFRNLKGIDPSAACVRQARQLTGLEIIEGSFPALGSWKELATGIILSHVLEHVRDFQEVFKAADQYLKQDGWLYVEVPDASRYAECLAAPYQDFNTEHINHFTFLSLDNLLGLRGYEIIKFGQKTFEVSPSVNYPAVYCFARKHLKNHTIVPDKKLKTQLQEYVSKSEELMELLRKSLSKTFAKITKVVIWGTGQLTLKLLLEPIFQGVEIVAFVDSNPAQQGRKKMGKPVLSPDELKAYPFPVLVSSLVNEDSIMETIRSFQLSHPVYTLKRSQSGGPRETS
jgi:SAM-dependent methyltransferase